MTHLVLECWPTGVERRQFKESTSQMFSTLTFIRRGGGTVLFRHGFEYTVKKKYKNGSVVWECINRRRLKCRGKLTLTEDLIQGEKPHDCPAFFNKIECFTSNS